MKIFVSYSDKDKKKMIALEKAIKNTSSELKPIIVAKDKKPGIPLSEKVKEAINNCDILIPILTRTSIDNQWVNQEIGFATAKDKKIFPIVERNILKKLKGFIHSQLDNPFSFEGSLRSKHKESYSYKKSYLDLLDYLTNNFSIKPIFSATITPTKIIMGDNYTTKVKFKGKVKNGFFDNLVRHQDSNWKIWNWDTHTLLNSKSTTAGELHGYVNINKEYTHSTKDWPKGKHTIFVRIYDHPIQGETTRHVVAEDIKEVEVI
ncbi:MAG: toll/interleukin-1 receptor domain-containing protein [Bacteroidales bacterium]|nr:toll/interleukin-1 receptor domain-containing protein [Bacteroidales bacterium]